MIAFGILFDLFPLLLVVGVAVFVMYSLGGMENVGKGTANIQAANELAQQENTTGSAEEALTGAGIGLIGAAQAGSGAAQAAVGILAGGATVFFIGPLIYVIGSFITSTIAYFFFTIWFFMKGVNIWSFGSVERMTVNVCTFVVEHVPILDLLPGITFMVWRHVEVSRIEDTLKENALRFSVAQKLQSVTRM